MSWVMPLRPACMLAVVLAIQLLSIRPAMATSWVARYEGMGTDVPIGVVADDSDNVYVAGTSDGTATGPDIVVLKYAPSGAQVWYRRYDTPTGRTDIARSMCVAPDGGVYIAGSSAVPGEEPDALILKYDRDGALQWARTYDGGDRDFVDALAPMADGEVTVTGTTYVPDHGLDLLVMRYSATGTSLWSRSFDGAAHGNDAATGVVALESNSVMVTGIEADTTGLEDWIVMKLDAAGDTMWTRRFNGAANREDWPFAMKTDGNAAAVITGVSVGTAGGGDVVTRVYTTSGGLEELSSRGV